MKASLPPISDEAAIGEVDDAEPTGRRCSDSSLPMATGRAAGKEGR